MPIRTKTKEQMVEPSSENTENSTVKTVKTVKTAKTAKTAQTAQTAKPHLEKNQIKHKMIVQHLMELFGNRSILGSLNRIAKNV